MCLALSLSLSRTLSRTLCDCCFLSLFCCYGFTLDVHLSHMSLFSLLFSLSLILSFSRSLICTACDEEQDLEQLAHSLSFATGMFGVFTQFARTNEHVYIYCLLIQIHAHTHNLH
jgi:hypothetical protein